jgi:uncharacterized Zn finger protein (UPF0148 family)
VSEADRLACPKCGREVARSAGACPACGLSEQHFESFATAEGEAEAPAELHALWHSLAEDWEDEAAHERFVQAAAREGGFAVAARWYRRALRERRADDPRAGAALERIRRMAEAAWLSRPRAAAAPAPGQPRQAQPYRNLFLVLLALALAAVLVVITQWLLPTVR